MLVLENTLRHCRSRVMSASPFACTVRGLTSLPFSTLRRPFISASSFSTSTNSGRIENGKEKPTTAVRTTTQSAHVVFPSPSELSIFPAEITSGAPLEASRRSVRIFKPSKTAMQSGTADTNEWRLDFDIQEKWENPLMGWTSSADPLQAMRIRFNTKDEAILFAERQGYAYTVQEPAVATFKVKTYADNFKYSATKLRRIYTK